MTQAQYARHRRVSRSAVSRAIASGKIPFLTRSKRIDVRRADRAWDGNYDASKDRRPASRRPARAAAQAPGPTPAGRMPKLYESKARREHALAQLAEKELAQLNRELVPVKEVEEAGFAAARKTRDEILAIPDNWARALAEKSYLEVHAILVTESRRLCEAISGDPLGDAPPAPPAAAASTPPAPAPPDASAPSPPAPPAKSPPPAPAP